MSSSDLPCLQSYSDTTSAAILSKKASAMLLSLNDNMEHFLTATDYVNAFNQYLTTLNVCSEVCNLVAEQCSRTANTYTLQGLFNIFKMHCFRDYTSEESTMAFEKIIKELSHIEIHNPSDFVQLGTFGNLNSLGEMIAVRHIESKKKYMMKIYNKLDSLENNKLSNITTEFKITKSMASSELHNLEFSFQSDFHLYFLFEFVEGDIMTLQGTSGRLTGEKICYYLPQIMWAITRLHTWDYSHRDIQPKNIMLTSSGTLKLSNFGNAGKLSNGYSVVQNNQNIVLSEYSAPELIQAVFDAREYNTSVQVEKGCDFWSLGILIYKFYFGYVPFGDWEDDNTLHRILKFQKSVLFSDKVPEDLSKLMRGLIQQPENRFKTTHIENNVFYKNYYSEKNIVNIFNQYPFRPIIPDVQETTDIIEFSSTVLSVSELSVLPIVNFRFLPLSYREYSNDTTFSVTGAMNDELLAALTCFRELTSLTDNTLMQIFKSPVMRQLKLPSHKDYGINIPHVSNMLFVDVMDTLNELYYFLKYISFAVKRMFSLGKKCNDSTSWVENLIEGLKESIGTVGKIPYIKIKNIASRFDYIDTCYLVIERLKGTKSGEWKLLGEMIETILKSYLKLLLEVLQNFHNNMNIFLDCILRKDHKKYKIVDSIICFLNFITEELLEEKERMNGNDLTARVKSFEKIYQQNFKKVVREIQKFNRCMFSIIRELTDIKKYHERMSERSSQLFASRKGGHNNHSDSNEMHSSTSTFTKSGEEVIVPKEDNDILVSAGELYHNIEDEEESCNQSVKSSSNDYNLDDIYQSRNSDSVMSDTFVPQNKQPEESKTEVIVTDFDNVSNTCIYTVEVATSELSEENKTKGHNVSSKDSKQSSSSKKEKAEESSNAEERGSEQSQVCEGEDFKEQFSTIEMNRSEQFSNPTSEKNKPKQFQSSKQEQLKRISVTGSPSEKTLLTEKYEKKELIPQIIKITKEEYSVEEVQSISVKGKSVNKPVTAEANKKTRRQQRREKRKYALEQSSTKQFSVSQADKREESILSEKPKKSSDKKVEIKLPYPPKKEYSEKSSQHIGSEISGAQQVSGTQKKLSKQSSADKEDATKEIHVSEEHVKDSCKWEEKNPKLISVDEKQTDQFTAQSEIQKEIDTEISNKTDDVEIEHSSSSIVEDKSKHFVFGDDSITDERKTEELSVTKIDKIISEEGLQVIANKNKLGGGDTRLISPLAKDECKQLEVIVEGNICHATTSGHNTSKDLLSPKTEFKRSFEVKKVSEKEQSTIGKEKLQSIVTEKTEQKEKESLTLQEIKEQDTSVAQSAPVEDKSGHIHVVKIGKNRKSRKQQQAEMKKSTAEQSGTKQFSVIKEDTTEQSPLSEKPQKLSDEKIETKQLHPSKKECSEKLTIKEKQKPSQQTGSEVYGAQQVSSTHKKISKQLSAHEKEATKDIHVSEEHVEESCKLGDEKPKLISMDDKQIDQFTTPTEVREEIHTEKSSETEKEETEHSSVSTVKDKSKHAVGDEACGTQFSANEEGKYLQSYVSETDQSDYLQAPEERVTKELLISHVEKRNESRLVEEDITQPLKEYQTKKSSAAEPEEGEFLPVIRRGYMKQCSSTETDVVKSETAVFRHSEEKKTREEKSSIKQTESTEKLPEISQKPSNSYNGSFFEKSFLSKKTVRKDHAFKKVVGASEQTTKEDSSFINLMPKGEKLFSNVTVSDKSCNTVDTFDSGHLRGSECPFNVTMLMKADENELMNLYWMYTSATEESIRTLISVQKKIQYFEEKICEINQQLEIKYNEREKTGSNSKQDITKEVVDLARKEKFRKSDPIQKRHIFPYKEVNLQKKLTFNVIKSNRRPMNKTVGIESEVPFKLKKSVTVASQTSRASALATHRMYVPLFDTTKANCRVCRKLIMAKEKRMECSRCNIITHEMCLLFVSPCPYVGCDLRMQKFGYSKATCGYLKIRRSEHTETFFTVMLGQNITFYDCNVSNRRQFYVPPIEEFLSLCSGYDVVLNPINTEDHYSFEMKFLEKGCVKKSLHVIAEAPLQKYMWFYEMVKAASSEFFDYRSDNTGASGSSLLFPLSAAGKLIYPDEIKLITVVRYRVNDIVLIRDLTFVICCYEGLFTFDASNSEDVVELKGLNNVTKLTYLSAPYTYSYAIAETCITRKRNMVQINSKALYDIVGMQNNGNFFISAEPIKNLKHTVSDFIMSTDQDVIVAAARTTVLVIYLSQDGDVEAMKAVTFNSFIRCLNFIEEDTAIGVYAGAFHKIKFLKDSKLTVSSLITHKQSNLKLVRIASSDPHSFMRIQSIYRRDHFEYFIIVGRKIFLCLDNPNGGIKRIIEGFFGGVIHSEHFDDILRIIDSDKITYYDFSRVNSESNEAAITLSSADILQKLNFKDAYNVFGGSGRFDEPTILASFKDGITQIANLDNYNILINARQIMYATLCEAADTQSEKLNLYPVPDVVKSNEEKESDEEEGAVGYSFPKENVEATEDLICRLEKEDEIPQTVLYESLPQRKNRR